MILKLQVSGLLGLISKLRRLCFDRAFNQKKAPELDELLGPEGRAQPSGSLHLFLGGFRVEFVYAVAWCELLWAAGCCVSAQSG